MWAPIDMFLFPPALEAQLEELEKNHFHLQRKIFELVRSRTLTHTHTHSHAHTH